MSWKARPSTGLLMMRPIAPLVRVRAHEDDAALEARIGHPGQGDQQLSLEEILACNGLRLLPVSPCAQDKQVNACRHPANWRFAVLQTRGVG